MLLIIRAGYLLYGLGVEALNLDRYRTPGLAVLAALLALAASTALGLALWRLRAMPLAVAAPDALVCAAGQVLLAMAMRPSERLGSLNWMLAYAVACAIWLGLGREWLLRAAVALLLGAAYLATTLASPSVLSARTLAVAIPNALSPFLFFWVSRLVIAMLQGITASLEAARALELEQKAEIAALRERSDVFTRVHARALEALDLVALDPGGPDARARQRARSTVRFLREWISDRTAGAGLRLQIAGLLDEVEGPDLTVELIDHELTREPGPRARELLSDWLREILGALSRVGTPGTVNVRVFTTDSRVQITVRASSVGGAEVSEVPSESVATSIAAIGGTVDSSPLLPTETRLRVSIPL